jgi:hypothetical protein
LRQKTSKEILEMSAYREKKISEKVSAGIASKVNLVK